MNKSISKLFGTDGVRGKANKYPMVPEVALSLGRAVGKILRQRYGKARVVIGKDTRLSCYVFENALISGLCCMGIDTLMVGPLPTPGVAFITRAYRADAGIVISASHNPYFDNGIKFFDANGFKLPDTWESEIEQIIASNDYSDCLPEDHEIGRNTKIADADGRYIEFVKATFPRKISLKNLTIVLDCAHGPVIGSLLSFPRTGCKSIYLRCIAKWIEYQRRLRFHASGNCSKRCFRSSG